jgi:hypothetical protein
MRSKTRLALAVVSAALLTLVSAGSAGADTVSGDRVDVTGITGHSDGTQTASVSYNCASGHSYPDLLIGTYQAIPALLILDPRPASGQGHLGSSLTCDASTHTASITLSAVDSSQWLTDGPQHFDAFLCTAVSSGECTVDTGDDSTDEGTVTVSGGKDFPPNNVTPDTVVVTDIDATTQTVTGVYDCPTGTSHYGEGGQIFQDQGGSPTRVVGSWEHDTSATCDGYPHSFTATYTNDQSGEALTNGTSMSSSYFITDDQTLFSGNVGRFYVIGIQIHSS